MLKKIALLVVMFALPLGAMAQAKFAHMNSQDVIAVMPEFTKAKLTWTPCLKNTRMKCSVPTKNSRRSIRNSWHKPTLCRKTLQKDVRKSCRIWLNAKSSSNKKLIKVCRKQQQDAMAPIYPETGRSPSSCRQAEGVVYIFDLARTPIPFVETQERWCNCQS